MSMADSRSFVGGMPLALISSCWVSRQLSFVMVGKAPGPCNSRTGSGNGFGMPKRVRDGPIARMITCFGTVPVMMKPPMPTWSPVKTWRRVERFNACEVGGTVAVAVAVAVGVAVAVAVAVGVAGGGGLATKSARSFLFVMITWRLGGVK